MARRDSGHTNAIRAGRPAPLGASCVKTEELSGVNFAIWSENASQIDLCVFEDGQDNGGGVGQCPGDGHALLLTAGELQRLVLHAVAQPDVGKQFDALVADVGFHFEQELTNKWAFIFYNNFKYTGINSIQFIKIIIFF